MPKITVKNSTGVTVDLSPALSESFKRLGREYEIAAEDYRRMAAEVEMPDSKRMLKLLKAQALQKEYDDCARIQSLTSDYLLGKSRITLGELMMTLEGMAHSATHKKTAMLARNILTTLYLNLTLTSTEE